MSNTLEIVNRFLEAYWAGDVEQTTALATEDFLWVNMPAAKMRIEGREALRALMQSQHNGFPEAIEQGEHVSVFGIADGNIALHERVDRYKLRGKWFELPCNGHWELRDGRVQLWRDYFDLNTYVAHMASIGITIDTSPWL